MIARQAPRLLAGATVLVVLAGTPLTQGDDAPAPITNVDVVRMVARRVPQEEILRAIREAPSVRFDLDAEVVVELRRAGVRDPIIEAMREAAARAVDPGAQEVPPVAAPVPSPGAILTFEGDPEADPATRTAVFFREDPQGRPVALAFFVLCVSPHHVPDLWITKTPLTEGTPRHRMIAFHDRTAPLEGRRGRDRILLDLPPAIGIPLDEGFHTLVFGVSARVGDDPPVPIASVESPVRVPPDAPARVVIALSTRDLGRLKAPPRGAPLHSLRVVSVDPDPIPRD